MTQALFFLGTASVIVVEEQNLELGQGLLKMVEILFEEEDAEEEVRASVVSLVCHR